LIWFLALLVAADAAADSDVVVVVGIAKTIEIDYMMTISLSNQNDNYYSPTIE
jgi:hypothetical protein